MFNKTNYNFRKFHPIKLHKHSIKKHPPQLHSFENKINDSGGIIIKSRIEGKKEIILIINLSYLYHLVIIIIILVQMKD